MINKYSDKLDMLKTMQNHNISHLSQLNHFTPEVVGQPSPHLQSVIIDEPLFKVHRDQMNTLQRYRKLDLGSCAIDGNGEMDTRSNWAFASLFRCQDRSSTNGIGMGLTTTKYPVILTWSFHQIRKVTLDIVISCWTCGIVRARNCVLSLFHTFTSRPRRSAVQVGDDVLALSSMRRQSWQMVR